MNTIQILEANMLDHAKQSIIDNNEWLSADELLEKYHIPKENLNLLIQKREVFPSLGDSLYLYNSYLFDKNGNILPEINLLQQILTNKDKWGLLKESVYLLI